MTTLTSEIPQLSGKMDTTLLPLLRCRTELPPSCVTDTPGEGGKCMKGQSSLLQLGIEKPPWQSEHLVQNP